MNEARIAAAWSLRINQLRTPDRIQVAACGKSIVGYCYGGAVRRPEASFPGATAEIHALYVHPDFQGCGIGSVLMFAAASGLNASGFESLVLWVLTGNRIGKRFYEHLCGETGDTRPIVVNGTPAQVTLYRWDSIKMLIDRLEMTIG